MLAEITLRFDAPPEDEFGHRHAAPSDVVETIEARCPTELAKIAYDFQSGSGANVVNFHFVNIQENR